MTNKGLFARAVTRLLPRADTVNREGVPAYANGAKAKLVLLAATGNAGGSSDAVFDTIARFAAGGTRDWAELMKKQEV